jgi:mono/diheme cytochrome c family protein
MNRKMHRVLPVLLVSAAASLAPQWLAAADALADDVPFTIGAGFESPVVVRDGKLIYQRVCQGCHMADGKGATGAGAYPSLAGNVKLVAKTYPAFVVLKGLAAMPAFGPMMDDEQVAAVVNYLRGNFGNRATDSISAAEVAPLRASAASAPGQLKGR